MERIASPLKSILFFSIIAGLVLVLGYLYVASFTLGYRAIIVVHGAVLFFLGVALFANDLRAFLLFVVIFLIPLQFGYHLIHEPLVDIESQPFSSGIALDSVDVVLLFLYGHWLISAAYRKKILGWPVIGGSLGAMLIIWIIYIFIQSSLKSVQFKYSFFEIFVLFKGFLLFFYLVNNISSVRDIRIVVYSLFAGTVAHAIYIILQFVTHLNYTLRGELVKYIGPEGFRSAGFFGSPDAAAALMSLVFPVGLAYYFTVRDAPKRGMALFCLGLTLLAMFFTKVRAAWLATLVSSVVLIALSFNRGWISTKMIYKAAFVIIFIILMASPYIIYRFETGTWGEDRVPLISTAWNMVKSNWVLGVGANNYPFDIQKYVPVNFRYSWAYTVHNEYLLRFAETGIIGALLYYLFNGLMMLKLWRHTQSREPWIFLVSAGFFAALVGSIPHRMFSFYHYVNMFMQLCVMLALTYSMEVLESRKVRNKSVSKKLK